MIVDCYPTQLDVLSELAAIHSEGNALVVSWQGWVWWVGVVGAYGGWVVWQVVVR